MSYTTSRSRVLKGQECPRQRYWAYEFNERGLLSPGQSLVLDLGIQIHALLENANCGLEINSTMVESLDRMVSEKNYLPQNWEFNPMQTLKEHRFFIEVAGRVIVPRIAARISEHFNVMSVEGVHIVKLVDGIDWYSREDGILQHKEDNKRWTFSFKTCQKFQTRRHLDVARVAMQNLSEPWAAMADGYEDIQGVAQLWFEVGDLKEDRKEGIFARQSPLIRPYYDGEKFYWNYRWTDIESKSHQVPKGAKKVFIGDLLTVDEWIGMIEVGEVEGLDFNQVVFGPILFPYSPEKAQRWKTQITAAEKGRVVAREAAQLGLECSVEDWKIALDLYYPQHERACPYCPFYKLCHGGNDALLEIGRGFQMKEERVRKEIEDD